MSYREPQQYPQQPHRGSQVFQPPPPYSPTQTNPQSSSYQQPPQGNWGHRLSYPSTMNDQQRYASLPRPPPAPTSEWGGSVPRQGYVPAQPRAVAGRTFTHTSHIHHTHCSTRHTTRICSTRNTLQHMSHTHTHTHTHMSHTPHTLQHTSHNTHMQHT